MDESNNNNNSKQQKRKSQKDTKGPTGLMSPNLTKHRTTPGNPQLTMESSNSRVGSSHGQSNKPPVSKRGDKEQQSAKANRRGSKMKVEPPAIISSNTKISSMNELLEQSQSQKGSSHNVASLNNISNSKEKKNKSALRPKENNSKLSEKGKLSKNNSVKKSKEQIKRNDSSAMEEEKLQMKHQRSKSAEQEEVRSPQKSGNNSPRGILSDTSFNDPEVSKIQEDGGEMMQLNVPEVKNETELQENSSNKSNVENQEKPNESEADNEDEVEDGVESNKSSNDEENTNTNLAEQFRLAMKQTLMSNAQMLEFMPPPEDLIKKSLVDDEPVKTGAPIPFIKFNRLLGRERIEKMNPDNENRGVPPPVTAPVDTGIAPASTISDYMINAKEANRIVYCRFGEKYIQDLEKRKNSNISSLNAPNMSSASYLINIKKLIEDYNIDGEKRDFKQMRSGQMGKLVQMPPQQFYKPTGPDDKTLVFESRFESGNLLAAIKVSENEYDLVLQNDINTNGNTQWYFFRCSNTTKGQKVKFNILNLAKPDSLYNYGMKILCFSNKIKEEEGIGWHRVGEAINYHANTYKRDQCRFFRTYFTFTFTHTFEHDDDQQFFAHCFPYTYSDLQEDLNRIEKDPETQNFFHKGFLTRTLAGNKCDFLTITSKDKDPKSAKALAKKGVFISARVHPGESNASWMMKGVIEYLVSNTPEAKALRDHFVFKIVPILNPDGVINGNYRCSLAGQDLNRRWKAPSKILHPVNSAVKKLIRSFVKEREIVLYCDLHGHSRRKNIFMYGNNIKEQPHSTRVFPYIMSKLCDYFSFEQSRFSMSRTKDGTARVAMFKELNIPNIFTMEASFCGADKGKFKDQHFTTEYLMMAGQRLLEALIVYSKLEVKQSINEVKSNKEEQQVAKSNYQTLNALALEKELTENKKLINMTMGEEGNSSGSDSEPSADNLEEDEMAKIVPMKPKKAVPVKKEPPVKPVPKKPAPPVIIKKPQSPQEKKRPAVMKDFSKSPTKKPFGYNYAFDRLSLRKKKPEMKDAWTQTTPKSKEQQEKERREHRQRKNAQYLLVQQQQQMMMQKYQQQQLNVQHHRGSHGLGDTQHSGLQGTLGDMAARNHQRQIEMRNPGSIMQKGVLPVGGAKQTNSGFNLNPLMMSQSNNKIQKENTGQSPQPQIRIRTDTFKSKPSNDLAKYEEKLQENHMMYKMGGPQHGSVTQNHNHRGSNKKLPQIQSANSQRKANTTGGSSNYNTFNNTNGGHNRQISGQSPSHNQIQPPQSQPSGARRLIHGNNQPYSDKKQLQSQQNPRQQYHVSISPNKMNRMNNLAGSVALTGSNTGGVSLHTVNNMPGGFSSALAYVNTGIAQVPQTIHGTNPKVSAHGSVTAFQQQQNINLNRTLQQNSVNWQNMTSPMKVTENKQYPYNS